MKRLLDSKSGSLFQCGANGIRTRVQTRNVYAFYTLIPAFGFRALARPGPPTNALSSKISSPTRGFRETISDCTAPLDQGVSEKEPLSDVSSRHLVAG